MKHAIACLVVIVGALILIAASIAWLTGAYTDGSGPERIVPVTIICALVLSLAFALIWNALVGIWEDVRPWLEKIAGRAM